MSALSASKYVSVAILCIDYYLLSSLLRLLSPSYCLRFSTLLFIITCSRIVISEWPSDYIYFNYLWSWASFFGITSFTYTYYLSCWYEGLELLLFAFISVFRLDFFLDRLCEEPDIADFLDGECKILFSYIRTLDYLIFYFYFYFTCSISIASMIYLLTFWAWRLFSTRISFISLTYFCILD